ncbi:Lectin receptor kinase [Melia azedarach]|uniref:Lectin receptor kinase n=1 Tax=Melia azedarach TaxID=155640 RepID=A0ACC1Y1Q3_MELAZ|nr:Lectin receptor kinase [Melia azedarach]
MEVLSCFLLHLLLTRLLHVHADADISFVYNGFTHSNLTLEGASYVRPGGILTVTNKTEGLIGHALYPTPFRFKTHQFVNNTNKSVVMNFSTNFVFSILPKYPDLGGQGLAFVLMSTKWPKNCLPNQFLGLPNGTSNVKFSTRFLAVEFDIIQNTELLDINDNHVGIDISSLISSASEPASYYSSKNNGRRIPILLRSGDPIQTWVDYNSQEMLMNVTISPLGLPRPRRPLISFPIDLSLVLDDYMYTGFSASTGLITASHNVHAWSFSIGEDKARTQQGFDPRKVPIIDTTAKQVVHTKGFAVGITLSCLAFVILIIAAAIHVLHKIKHADEILEDWEIQYGARRFKYTELSSATKGFGEKNLIGSGGFGRVYKGVIPSLGVEVAIKRIGHNSQQGMKEFVAEITSMGRLRHRNLVQLHGWCRKQDELLLVYDYMPNGSLDKLLFGNDHKKKKLLTWDQRYKILVGIAQALLYLHEECNQRVVHRDVKPSNVLIDADLTAKLGDFGLAKIYEHGINPKTTHIVGTLGYLAPELTRTGKATTSTDVYSYGILMLEVACRRRSIDPQKSATELLLVDWVKELHLQGEITRAIDPMLDDYDLDEAVLVLNLGLLCSILHPVNRPSMRRVVQILLGQVSLPPLPPEILLRDQDHRNIMGFSDFPNDSDLFNSKLMSSHTDTHTSTSS